MRIAQLEVYVEFRPLELAEFDRLSRELLARAVDLARETVPQATELELTLEDGSLFHRIVVYGWLFLVPTIEVTSHYHDLRESVVDIVHDGRDFSQGAMDNFHKVTHAAPAQVIYKRTVSEDVERLHRILDNCERVARGVPYSQMAKMRRTIVHDLAELARANPNDPEVQKIIDSLPRAIFPKLPTTPQEAIDLDRRRSKSPQPKMQKAPHRPPPRHSFKERVRIKQSPIHIR